jgi:surfeit locus 1 family protein
MLARWRDAGLVPLTAATLAAFLLLCGLGTWQMGRKTWKEGLLAQRAALAAQTPAEPGDALFQPGGIAEYTRLRLSGRFHHDKERYWFADGREGSGYHVYTPFEIPGKGILWVNRGYIPKRLRDPATRIAGQLQGTASVIGVVRYPGERNRFTPDNDVARNQWYWRDLPALQASAFAPNQPYAPVMVDAEALPSNPGGWPDGGAAQVPLSNRHLEYALTWYALAATLIAVFCVFARGRLAQRPE